MRAKRILVVSVLAALIGGLCQVASAAGATWTVHASAPSGCASFVCRTLTDALTAASSGDVIEVRSGTFVNTSISKSGITIRRAANATNPVFKGATRVYGSDIVLRNLYMEGALYVEPGAQRVTVDTISSTDLFVGIRGANDVVVRNSTIDGKDDVDILNITNGATNVLIENNRITGAHMSDYARSLPYAEVPHIDCVQMFGGGQNITFRRNVIGDCDMSAFMIKSDRGALRNVLFERNFIAECAPVTVACDAFYALQIHAGTDAHWTQAEPTDPSAYYPLEGLTFRHNTIDGGILFGNRFIGPVDFRGNVVTAGATSPTRSIAGECGNHTFEHNVISGGVQCTGYATGNNTAGSVLFVNRDGVDLHLATGSAGRETGSPWALAAGLDIDGHAVCGAADAGADETCPGAGVPPAPTTTATTQPSSTTSVAPTTTTTVAPTTTTTAPKAGGGGGGGAGGATAGGGSGGAGGTTPGATVPARPAGAAGTSQPAAAATAATAPYSVAGTRCRATQNPPPVPDPASSAGYWVLSRSGKVAAHGAPHLGDIGGTPAVKLVPTATGNGYWILDWTGAVHAFGDAKRHGDMRTVRVNAPIVSMAALPNGQGYWLLGADGGVFSFGAARFHGSTGSLRLNRPIIDIAPTTDGSGYWLLGSDGGVFAFGSAKFRGSTGAMRLAAPVISMATHPGGQGYWLLGADGGVFSFGVPFRGSVPGIGLCTTPEAVQMRATADGRGYYALLSSGSVATFGNAFHRGASPTDAVDLAVRI